VLVLLILFIPFDKIRVESKTENLKGKPGRSQAKLVIVMKDFSLEHYACKCLIKKEPLPDMERLSENLVGPPGLEPGTNRL
jgi:hypothetical protein